MKIRSIGLPNTKEMFFTARTFQGDQLRKLGLVNDIVPGSDLQAVTDRLADEIAGHASIALKGIKRVLNLLQYSQAPSLDVTLEAQTLVGRSAGQRDLVEGWGPSSRGAGRTSEDSGNPHLDSFKDRPVQANF